MRKLAILLVLALLAVPAAVAKPPKPSEPAKGEQHGKGPKPAKGPKKRMIQYVLRGTLSGYTAASGETKGSISILVKSANHHGKALRGMTLTFAVTTETKVKLNAQNAIADGDRGIVKVRAPKKADATALQSMPARQVIDKQESDS